MDNGLIHEPFPSSVNMVVPLVECVPNFSEGKDVEIINSITNAMVEVDGVTLLDVDMGADFNRTVVTIVGQPSSVLEAAINGTKVALDMIDMSTHSGEHARMGAVDVVPFIPISGVTMEECVQLSIQYAEQVSSMYDLPIYLYAEVHENQIEFVCQIFVEVSMRHFLIKSKKIIGFLTMVLLFSIPNGESLQLGQEIF